MNFIITAALKGVKELYNEDVSEGVINLQDTRKEFEGQVTIVVFPLIKVSEEIPGSNC